MLKCAKEGIVVLEAASKIQANAILCLFVWVFFCVCVCFSVVFFVLCFFCICAFYRKNKA